MQFELELFGHGKELDELLYWISWIRQIQGVRLSIIEKFLAGQPLGVGVVSVNFIWGSCKCYYELRSAWGNSEFSTNQVDSDGQLSNNSNPVSYRNKYDATWFMEACGQKSAKSILKSGGQAGELEGASGPIGSKAEPTTLFRPFDHGLFSNGPESNPPLSGRTLVDSTCIRRVRVNTLNIERWKSRGLESTESIFPSE